MSHRAAIQNDLDVIPETQVLHGAKSALPSRRGGATDIEKNADDSSTNYHQNTLRRKISSETKMASVTLEIQDALAVVTVSNSPLNLFTWEMLDELSDINRPSRRRAAPRTVVEGNGQHFSAAPTFRPCLRACPPTRPKLTSLNTSPSWHVCKSFQFRRSRPSEDCA